MKKETLIVPAGIRYMSDWAKMENGYKLEKYQFPHIVNKQITGCGFTEYCLRNNLNIILCSPRKILLENKEGQHTDDVYYVKTTTAGESLYDADLSSKKRAKTCSEADDADLNQIKSAVYAIKTNIRDYYEKCRSTSKPCKLLVTYDSFRHIKDALSEETLNSQFYIVIDEFQSIFVDSRFKSNTEIEFMSVIRGLTNICFVSATPMLDRYLEMLDEFKDLPYFEFDWSKEDVGRVIHPRLTVKHCTSLSKSASSIIEKYKCGEFDKYSYKDNATGKITEVESKEAVLYFNSVKNICELIKKNQLTQEECNVLCANTVENETQVRRAFGVTKKNFQGISKVPKRNEPHKMFTLCTRTVYLGADFYSTCAQTFIFSDSNIDCLAVDISLDLPQILGRQRLEENPWKNSAVIYFKPTDDKHVITKEEFDKYLQNKLKTTNNLLKVFESAPDDTKLDLVSTYEMVAKYSNYKNNYIAVNHRDGGKMPVPVLNSLVMISEMRAFDIQQVDYKDRFTVFNAVRSSTSTNPNDTELGTYIESLKTYTTFIDKMRYICNISEKLTEEGMEFILTQVPSPFDNYYRVLGPERCKALSYQKDRISAEYDRLVNNQDINISKIIQESFSVGECYRKPDIKAQLSKIYLDSNYKKTAKASDICNYFNTVDCDVFTEDGKRLRGFKLISKKELL